LGLEPFLSTCFVTFVFCFVFFVVNHVSPLAHARGIALINRSGALHISPTETVTVRNQPGAQFTARAGAGGRAGFDEDAL
jgi:hypothetical protein